ncbi:MAG: hypothetical protein Kow0056_08520 [Coriobacteriia bacterium]
MALADILRRIESDADEEAFCILDEAKREADWIVEQAKGEAELLRERILAEARAEAEREKETALANARLQARDRSVAARLELVSRVLRQAEETLLGLPDDEYAAFIARSIVRQARGDERVLIGSEDEGRLASQLPEAVSKAAEEEGITLALEYADERVPGERGVILMGERSRVEVSPAAILRERAAEMKALAARALFADLEVVPDLGVESGELGEYS